MRKTMSLKQLAANRANARKSTGPKTSHGKALSKLNALKHGILSREVLVRGRNYQESRHELTQLHQRFWDELQPVGPVEEMLVDQIVTAHWRLRRALTAESGEIALSVDEGQWQRSRGVHPQVQWAKWGVFGDPVPCMEESALGNRLLESWLREVRAAVERAGELTEAAIQIPFHGQPNSLAQELEGLRQRLLHNPEGLDAMALRERNLRESLAQIDRRLRSQGCLRAVCEEREANVETARQAAAVLPSAGTLDKIQRYETKLERQMYRAMAQLERLQRLRQGEAVPAPLSVEVGHE